LNTNNLIPHFHYIFRFHLLAPQFTELHSTSHARELRLSRIRCLGMSTKKVQK
jgi:hypothetical protein